MIVIVNRTLIAANELFPSNNGYLVGLFEGSNGNINQLIRR